MPNTRTTDKRRFARMLPCYANAGHNGASLYYRSLWRHRAFGSNTEKYVVSRVGWQVESGAAVLYRPLSGDRFAVARWSTLVPPDDLEPDETNHLVFAMPFRLEPFLVLFVASQSGDLAFQGTTELEPEDPYWPDCDSEPPDYIADCFAPGQACRWCTTITPGDPNDPCGICASPICDQVGCVGEIENVSSYGRIRPDPRDPEEVQQWDIRGNADDIQVGGLFTARQYLQGVEVEVEPLLCDDDPNTHDWFCYATVERGGSDSHHIQCHEMETAGVELPEYPNKLPYEDYPKPTLILEKSTNRRSTVVHMRYALGERTIDGPGGGCWATQNPILFTSTEYCENGYTPHYMTVLNEGIAVDANMGYRRSGFSHPSRDQDGVYLRLCDDILAAANGQFTGLVHANTNGASKMDAQLAGVWRCLREFTCEDAPVIETIEAVRFKCRSTGLVYEADLVLTALVATVSLGFLPRDGVYYILGEVTAQAFVGIRRRNEDAPRNWFPSWLDPDNPANEATLRFAPGSRCAERAIAEMPGGHTHEELFIAQAFDAQRNRWGPIPRRVDWRGLLAPAPWGNPAWEPVTYREVAYPCWPLNATGWACRALEAINGLVIPAEPTRVDSPGPPPPTAPDWGLQELTGDVVLICSTEQAEGEDCHCDEEI